MRKHSILVYPSYTYNVFDRFGYAGCNYTRVGDMA